MTLKTTCRLLGGAAALGGLVTAYQAAKTTKKETGGLAADKYLGYLKLQALKNTRTVTDIAKRLTGKYLGTFREVVED